MDNWEIYNYVKAKEGGGGGSEFKAVLDSLIDRSITQIDSDVSLIGEGAFSGCASLATVNFPIVTNVGKGAFSGCASLTTVNFPIVTNVGKGAFSGCASLTTVEFPSIVNFNSAEVFLNCPNLTTVNIPLATAIGQQMFQHCPRLTTIDLPSVIVLMPWCFKSSGIATLILRAQQIVSLSTSAVFDNTPIGNGTGGIYVPDNLVSDYKIATNWTMFEERIKGLSELEEVV